MASNAYFAFIASVSATGAFLFGLDIGYLSAILEDQSFLDQITGGRPLTAVESGTITAAFTWGAILGSFPIVSAYFQDTRGRKGTMSMGVIIFLIGALLQVFASYQNMMTVGRFIAGISIGLLSASIPLYQSEIAPSELRGTLTSFYQLMITVGIVVAQVLNYFVLSIPGYGWRLSIAAQVVPAAVLAVLLPSLPYSPRWLITQNRHDEAKQVFLTLYDEERAYREFADVCEVDAAERQQGKVSWGDLFTRPRLRGLLVVGILTMLLQQLSGMNIFMMYGVNMITELGFDGKASMIALSMTNTVSTFAGIFTIDLLGRKALFILGGLGMASCCFVSAVTTADFPKLIAMFLFVFFFASTWGPVAWVFCAEIFPSKYRTRLIGCSTTANWTGASIVAFVYKLILAQGDSLIYYVTTFACVCCAGFGVWIPETKGVGLEFMPLIFDGKLPRDPNSVVPSRASATQFGGK